MENPRNETKKSAKSKPDFVSGCLMPVKEERDDEQEIAELANKIKQANRAKLAQGSNIQSPLTGPLNMAKPGQPTIQQYFNGNSKEPATNGTAKAVENDKPVDEESKKGRFGWFDIEKQFLPYIFR